MKLLLTITLAAVQLFGAVTVTKSHPNRLVVDEARLAIVQAKIGSPDWNTFKAVIDANKNNLGSTWPGFLTRTALGAALICRATGDTSYCTDALAQMQWSRTPTRTSIAASFDVAGGYLVNAVDIYFTETPPMAGVDFPISFWKKSGSPVLPSPLVYDTTYWIKWHHTGSNSSYWTISTARGGSPISMSGTPSGTAYISAPWREASGVGGAIQPQLYMREWAVLYEWLNGYMTAPQKQEWYDQLRASLEFTTLINYKTGGKILNNVWVMDLAAALAYGIAIIGDYPDDAASVQVLLDKIDAEFATELVKSGAFLTGGFIEGAEYGPEQQSYLWEGWDSIYTASGRTDNRSAARSAYYTGMVDYYTHSFFTAPFIYNGKQYRELMPHGEMLKGGVWDVIVGGAKRFAPAITHRRILLNLQAAMDAIPDTTRGGYVKTMLDSYAPIDRLKDADVLSAYDIIFYRPSQTAASWDSSPLVKAFTGTNDIFMKSAWDSSATNVNVFGTRTNSPSGAIDHIRSEAGGISFYRKGVQLTGPWISYSYDPSNNLPGEMIRVPGAGAWPSTYSTFHAAGAAPYNNMATCGEATQSVLSRFETSAAATYGNLDLTGPYQNCNNMDPYYDWYAWNDKRFRITTASREWVYLPPDVLVVHDRIAKTKAFPTSQWNLQAHTHAVTVSGNTATISTATQSLRATVALPVNPRIIVRPTARCPVQWVSRSEAPTLYLEAQLVGLGTSSTITLTGATGDWAALNGAWTFTAIDGRTLQLTAGQVNTSAISATFGGQALVITGTGSTKPFSDMSAAFDASSSLPGGKYIEVGGTETQNENFLVVMEGADSGVTPRTVTALTSTNLDAAQIGNEVVGFVPQTLTLPITYQHGASGLHRIAGLTPGGAYTVDLSTPGQVTITAGGSSTASSAGVLSYYTGAAPLTLPGATLADGTVAVAYSQQIAALGGTSPYAYSVTSGTLPLGLTLTGGTISGAPVQAGSYSFSISVTDSAQSPATVTQTYSIQVASVSAPTLAVTTVSLPNGSVGMAYTGGLTAANAVLWTIWNVSSGALPPGLALNASTGAITGTPTTATIASFTVRVTDAAQSMAYRALTITIAPAPPGGVQNASASGGVLVSGKVTR